MKRHIKNIVFLLASLAVFSAGAGSFDDFFRAVKSDNASGVRDLLQRGFDPNTRDAYGQTGLVVALKEPSPRVTKVLIDSPKTDVNAVNDKGESPLMLAAIKGQQDNINALLQRDAAVNKTGWTPLHYATTSSQLTIMKQLLEQYAFIDAQSPNGTTPLMMAAMYGSSEAVKLLIDEGADPLMKNEQGMTAVDFAKRANRTEAMAMISAYARTKAPAAAVGGKW
jgi:ankyrin repeat protein